MAAGAVALAAYASSIFIPTAWASTLERATRFDIPAQPLASAMLEFGRQAPAEFILPAELVAAATSYGVRGDFTPSAALGLLLRCTGIEGKLEHGGIVLRRTQGGTPEPPSARLPPMTGGPDCGERRGPLLVGELADASPDLASQHKDRPYVFLGGRIGLPLIGFEAWITRVRIDAPFSGAWRQCLSLIQTGTPLGSPVRMAHKCARNCLSVTIFCRLVDAELWGP
jgi:hypothetical protein